MSFASLRIGIISLGCSKNRADLEIMLGYLLKAGHLLEQDLEAADVILINTCGFIEPARLEAQENIDFACEIKADDPSKIVIVSGCLPQRYADTIARDYPYVDAFVGVDEIDRIVDIVQEALTRKSKKKPLPPTIAPGLPTRLFAKPMEALRLSGREVAYIKIGEGCDHACAFCAIPSIRGRLRSRPVEEILSEARELLATGVKEINLVGQDVTAYGRDFRGQKETLASLLRALDQLEGEYWIRFLYGFHNRVTDELLAVVAHAKHILPYFDLPIQHSHPDILRAMRRADTIQAIETFPERLRALPGATLRTTCMVGFLGETDEHFEALLVYVKKVKFDQLGTFIFSPEEGTAAAELPGLPDADVANQRFDRLMKAQQRIVRERNRARVGTLEQALILGFDHKGDAIARTRFQAPEVDGITRIPNPPKKLQPGTFVTLKITAFRGYDLVAKVN